MTDLRAADADREQVAERLRTSHAEGRLDLAEFQERLEHCYEAKTLGQLAELVADLPRPGGRRRPRRPVVPFAPILIALVVVSAAIGHHVFWFWIPLVFFLCRTTFRRAECY